MAKYFLDHAPKGKSFLGQASGPGEALAVSVLADDEAKQEWIRSLDQGDQVFTIFGVSDLVSLALYDRGITVRRISMHHLPQELKKLSRRPVDRAKVLAALAKANEEKPDAWYQYRPLDSGIATVRANSRCFYTIQEKIRKSAEQFLEAAYREAYLVDPLRRELTQEQYIKRQLADDKVFEEIDLKEKDWLKKVEQSLKGIPIWDDALKGTAFRGIGPALAGIIIGETGDIRRFHSVDAYVCYCGAHAVPAREHLLPYGIDSELAQRRSGQAFNWQPRLRQAIWKWSFIQVPKMSTQVRFKDDPWVKMYLQFRNDELRKRNEYAGRQAQAFLDGEMSFDEVLRLLGCPIPDELTEDDEIAGFIRQHISENGIVIPEPRKSSEDEEEGENGRGWRWFGNMHCYKRACAKLRTKFVREVYYAWKNLVRAGKM